MQKSNPFASIMTLDQAKNTVMTIENRLTANHAEKWSNRYVPVSVIDMVEQAYGAGYQLHSTILPGSRKKGIESSTNGAYTLRAIKDDTREFMGDKVQSELYISNSFDAKRSLTVSLGMYRQVCSNGLMMGVQVAGITARHTTGIIEQVNGLELVDPWAEIEKAYGWMIAKVDERQSLGIIDQLGLSATAVNKIKELYNEPARIEDARGDVWSLYNIVNEAVESRTCSKYSFFNFNSDLNSMIANAYEQVK